MISQMEDLVTELNARKEVLIGDIEAKKGRFDVQVGEAITDDHKKEILDEISTKQSVLINNVKLWCLFIQQHGVLESAADTSALDFI